MMDDAIRRNGVMLGVFGLVTAALLAGTNFATQDKIALEERKVAQRALLELVPDERHDNDLLEETLPIPDQYHIRLGIASDAAINVARMNGKPVAFIIPGVAPDGYNGKIKLIVGVNVDGTLAGVRVISHNETPGLGDKVEIRKSDWIFSFDGRSLSNPDVDGWAVKKDGGEFDQFTGATITPRAVVNQVLAVLRYFDEDRDRLLKATELLPAPVNESPQEVSDNG
ncbi:MAG: electron transport complex subunit RsxG [bacterium]